MEKLYKKFILEIENAQPKKKIIQPIYGYEYTELQNAMTSISTFIANMFVTKPTILTFASDSRHTFW